MTGLKKTLGPAALSFYGIGMIIGAGIYSVIGAAAGEAGEGLWLSFVLGAIAALFTGLAYAELATAMPEAGAEFVYIRRMAPTQKWLAAVVGLMIVLAASGTAATVALAFGGYLKLFLNLPTAVSAAGLLTLCSIISISGIKQSSWTNIVFTCLEAFGLLLIIWFGFDLNRFGQLVTPQLHFGVLSGAAMIFFVYLGFEDIANLAEEARDPSRDIPRSIIISLTVTTVLYVLVSLAVLTLVSPQQLAQSEAPLSTAAGESLPAASSWLGWLALAATANTALITLIVASRMLYSMARRKAAPGVFTRLLKGRQTPWFAAIAVLAVSLLYLPLGATEITASLSSFGALLAFALVNIAAITLRYTEPNMARPYRMSVNIGQLPVPAVLGLDCVVTADTVRDSCLRDWWSGAVHSLSALSSAITSAGESQFAGERLTDYEP